MIQSLRNFADRFLGRGDATITVPSFDGALKPNQILEHAETVASFDAPEDLATDGKTVYIANGCAILDYRSGQRTEVRRFDKTITALCCLPDCGMAVVLDGREVRVFSAPTSAEATATITDPAMMAVNAIAPGFVDTEMTRWVQDDPAALAHALDSIPLHRIGSPEEIVGPMLFLLSDSARYVTGHILAVDGGSRHV